jgi:hypothetical protein
MNWPRAVPCTGTITYELLNALPCICINDAEMFCFCRHPLLELIGATDSFSGVRVFDKVLPVPSNLPRVQIVLENAIATGAASGNCARIPMTTTRPGNAVAVKSGRYVSRRIAVKVRPENAAHGGRFGFVNLKHAGLSADAPVPIAPAAIVPPIAHHTSLAAPCFGCEVLQVERAKQPLYADLNISCDAIGDRPDLDAGEPKPLVDTSQIFLISRDAIQRLGNDNVKLTVACVAHQPLPAKAIDSGSARDGAIRIHVDHHQIITLAHGTTQ